MIRDIASGQQQRVRSPRGRSIIAVIGIDKYPAWPALSNAVNDANGVSQLFQRLGFIEVTPPLLNGAATREAMWRLVTDEFAKLDSTDSLVLFFAGHGHTRITYPDGKPTKIGYVVPVDAAEARAATWVRLDFWLNEVALLPPRHILVIVDACHSGVALDAVVKWRGSALSTAALDELQARRSRRIITSALDDQRAMDGGPYPGHSLFTGCLIEGITGGIATRGQRVATGSQIGMYLQQRVSSYPRSQQTPDFGALDLDQRGEIVVPLLGVATEADTEPELTSWGRDSGPEITQGQTTADDASVAKNGHAPQLDTALAEVAAHETSMMQIAGRTMLATSWLRAAGALVILLGCAATAYAVTHEAAGGMSEAQTAAMTGAVARLDGHIRAARAAVQERASTLSKLITVRATIGSDATTLADQVKRGELAFAPGEGEILELGRINKKANNAVEELMVQPTGAMHNLHDGAAGSYADVVDNQLVITEVAEVVPKYTQDAYRGFLTVSRPVSLAPVLKPLLDAGITGQLVVGGKSMPIGAMPAGATTHEQPLGSGVKLVVAEPLPRAVLPLPILGAGIGAVVIGLLLLVVSLLGRRDAAPRAPFQVQPTGPPRTQLGSAATQLSQHGVAAASTAAPGGSMVASPGDSLVASNLGPGAMIGRWEVVRRLGSGGMADVYLAHARRDGGFENLVAIKIMHSHLARNQRAVDHFLDEARLAARIHHPNVVAIQDLGKIGNDYVIVMEYVEGVDLERLLTSARAGQRQVPLAVALGILCRICDGLDAAHRATGPDGSPLGIIHRDVKSANVLVSRQGSVKVVDFGSAKATKHVHYTVAGETKGTPAMMAPEQRVGDQVDVRADVYSVAAVGYELVTGQAVNLDLASLAHLGVENWPHLPLPSSLRAGLPVELDEILLHAMAFERERRPADCAAFGALCEAVMKRHNLVASDKDLARWVDSELRQLSPAFVGDSTGFSRSSPA